MDTLTFGNIIFLIIVGITIYHNMIIKKKDWKWLVIYIPLIVIAFAFSNILWERMFPIF